MEKEVKRHDATHGIKGIYRGEAGRWQCLDCLNNGTAEDEADEGIQHYAGCPALAATSPKRYEVDEYTGEKYKVEARYTEEARRLFTRYADEAGSSERAFVVVIAPMLETIMELRQRDEAASARSETAPLVAGDLKTQREIHDSYAPVSATRPMSRAEIIHIAEWHEMLVKACEQSDDFHGAAFHEGRAKELRRML